MRKLIVLLAMSSAVAQASVPTSFSVQGVLRDSSGNLQSLMVNVTASLWSAQSSGSKLAGDYGPTAVMAMNGLFTLPVDDAALQQKLAGASQVWLEVIVGSDTFARQPITSQLFAQMCGSAEKFSGNALTVTRASDDIQPAYFLLEKARGTAASPAPAAAGDVLGQINGEGYTGSGYGSGAAIRFRATESFTPAHNGTAMDFFTTPNGSANAAEESMTLDHNGLQVKNNVSSGAMFVSTNTTQQGLQMLNPANASDQKNAELIQSGSSVFGRFVNDSYTQANHWLEVLRGTGDSVASVSFPNGNVGVGTSTPTAALTVEHGAAAGALNIANDDNTYLALGQWKTSGGHDYRIGLNAFTMWFASGANYEWYESSAGALLMRLTNNGDLGVAGDVYARGTKLTSDVRLKKNIRTLEDALDDVERLRGVRFQWKSDSKPSIGVIAQEVEKVFPELVTDGPGHKSVEYANLVGVLIESTKELKRRNDSLEARVARLEARLGAKN